MAGFFFCLASTSMQGFSFCPRPHKRRWAYSIYYMPALPSLYSHTLITPYNAPQTVQSAPTLYCTYYYRQVSPPIIAPAQRWHVSTALHLLRRYQIPPLRRTLYRSAQSVPIIIRYIRECQTVPAAHDGAGHGADSARLARGQRPADLDTSGAPADCMPIACTVQRVRPAGRFSPLHRWTVGRA